jgi:outer membrane protein/adhesin transport system outer membrane protein
MAVNRWFLGSTPGPRLLGVAVLLVFGVGAVPAGAENLTQALALAYTNNPRLLAQRAALRAIDEQFPQALSGHRPTVSITVEAGKSSTRTLGAGLDSGTNTSPRSGAITYQQPIFRGLRTLYDTRRARATIMQARADLTIVEQDILFQTVTAFVNVVRDQAVLRLTVNNEQVLRRQLRATRDRFQVGEVTRTDVSQAQARLSQAQATRTQSEGTLQISRANYRRFVGRAPGRLKKPTRGLRLPRALQTVVSVATTNAPNVVSARYAELAARHNVKLITGELLPSINLKVTGSRSHGTSTGARSSVGTITGQLVIPLYQAGLTSSRIRQAKQVALQRHQDIIEARRAAIEAATQAWHALKTAQAQIRAFQSAARANAIALDGVRQEAAAGLRTVLDVLDAEQELLDARVNLVRAERDESVAAYQVYQAMGRLTAVSLKLPVPKHDPTAYYRRVKYLPWGPAPGGSDYTK